MGYSPEHYRCIQVYVPKKRSLRRVDKVAFFPTVIPYTQVNLENCIRQAVTYIVTILNLPNSSTTPTLKGGHQIRNAVLYIATTLNRAEQLLPEKITTPIQRVPIVPINQLKTTVSPSVDTDQAQRVKEN